MQTSLHGSARASQSGPLLPWRVGLASCVIVGARGVAFSTHTTKEEFPSGVSVAAMVL